MQGWHVGRERVSGIDDYVSDVPIRVISLVISLCALAAACTPSNTAPTTPSTSTATTTVSPPTTQPLATPSPPNPVDPDIQDPIEPPKRPDIFDTASDAFGAVGDFVTESPPDDYDIDALSTIQRWLPQSAVDALVWDVFTDGGGTNVLAISVIPSLTWRGDPNFLPALLETLTESETEVVLPGMFKVVIPRGLILFAQSTGDGFIVTTSSTPGVAMRYLEELSAESGPQTVWTSGMCLYIDPDTETLPYAPFPKDIVVPCEGAHNAEVVLSRQIGTDLAKYDADAITYERNYECDKAYSDVFGSQREHTPTLITYMPDEDEWNRGDRYLACVVELRDTNGPQLFTGPMADRSDLAWNPDSGACLDSSFAPQVIDCAIRHGSQFIGDVTVDAQRWPSDFFAVFTAACQDLLGEFLSNGPATVDVFASGLGPFAFEQGDRTVRCYAFALVDGQVVDVAGSFDGVWRVIDGTGIAA